jgi:hypothetical protein
MSENLFTCIVLNLTRQKSLLSLPESLPEKNTGPGESILIKMMIGKQPRENQNNDRKKNKIK